MWENRRTPSFTKRKGSCAKTKADLEIHFKMGDLEGDKHQAILVA